MEITKICRVLENIQNQVKFGPTNQIVVPLNSSEALISRDENSITIKIIKS